MVKKGPLCNLLRRGGRPEYWLEILFRIKRGEKSISREKKGGQQGGRLQGLRKKRKSDLRKKRNDLKTNSYYDRPNRINKGERVRGDLGGERITRLKHSEKKEFKSLAWGSNERMKGKEKN